MTTKLKLRLERKDQDDASVIHPGVMLTPALDENYWLYRVCLSEGQAVLGFPKFGIVGCGFAVEEDWNSNLPINCDPKEICDHIFHNAGDPSITRGDVIDAITLIREAARADGAGGRWED